jgi:hypothetical protein
MVGGAGRRRAGGDGAGPWITLLTPWAGRSTKLLGKVRTLYSLFYLKTIVTGYSG